MNFISTSLYIFYVTLGTQFFFNLKYNNSKILNSNNIVLCHVLDFLAIIVVFMFKMFETFSRPFFLNFPDNCSKLKTKLFAINNLWITNDKRIILSLANGIMSHKNNIFVSSVYETSITICNIFMDLRMTSTSHCRNNLARTKGLAYTKQSIIIAA